MSYRVINKDEPTKALLDRHASELMREKGADFSIREVCAAAGVSVGTFYTYYKSKSELILGRLNYRDQFLNQELEKAAPKNAEEKLICIASAYARYSVGRGVVSCTQVWASMQQAKITVEKDHQNALCKSILEAIQDGQKEGIFSNGLDAQVYADAMLDLLRGAGYNWSYYNGKDYDFENKAITGMKIFIAGMKKV